MKIFSLYVVITQSNLGKVGFEEHETEQYNSTEKTEIGDINCGYRKGMHWWFPDRETIF